MPYRVTRTTIVRLGGDRYEPGDEIEPTEAELAAFADNLEEVAADDDPLAAAEPVGDGEPVTDEGTADDGDDAAADADADADADAEICGAELSDGGTCERPVDECPYH